LAAATAVSPGMSQRELALLRGINVGGKHLVPMAALSEVFATLGCAGVQTYIQSGNVVFSPPAPGLSEEAIALAIEARFGFAVPVLVRTRPAIAKVLTANPFASPAADPRLLHAVFLAAPLKAAQKRLDRRAVREIDGRDIDRLSEGVGCGA